MLPYLDFQLSGPAQCFQASAKTPCGNSRLRIIHIGNTITYENQVFPICGNFGILVQQLLARKKSGVGVCSAFNRLLDCVFNGLVTGSKICKRSYVCLFIEDYNADLDLCFRFSVCSFSAVSIFSACSSIFALVDLSSTNTTSDASASSALGRDSVTLEVQVFVSSAVAVLDRETFHSMGSVPPEEFFVKVQTPCSVRSAVSCCSPVRTVPSSFSSR